MLKLMLTEMLRDPMTYWLTFFYVCWVVTDIYMRRNGML